MGQLGVVYFYNDGGLESGLLAFMVLVLGLGTIAWWQIITKAGFSSMWTLLPAGLSGTWILVWVLAFSGNLSGASGLQFFGMGLGFVTMIMFFVFAFVPWPVKLDTRRPAARLDDVSDVALRARLHQLGYRSGPGGRGAAPQQPLPLPPPPLGSLGEDPATPGAVATAAPPAAPAAPPSETYFCSWCGTERTRAAASVHYCGTRDRPVVHCSSCGQALDGNAFCSACGTPATQLSPTR